MATSTVRKNLPSAGAARETTLNKREILRTKTDIDGLFADGKSGFVYPVRFVKRFSETAVGESPQIKVLFAAPKKCLSKAWMRNKVKRRMREAYRLNKPQATEKILRGGRSVHIGLIYSISEILPYTDIRNAIGKILEKVARSG